MTDLRFFDRAGPYSLDELAELSGARLGDGVDGKQLMTDVAPLETADPEDVTFLDNRQYYDALAGLLAAAASVVDRFAARAPGGMASLLNTEPYVGLAPPA